MEVQDCAICLEGIEEEEKYSLVCNHSFHKLCIRKWFEQKRTCPYCRREILFEGNSEEVKGLINDGIVNVAKFIGIVIDKEWCKNLAVRTQRVLSTPFIQKCVDDFVTDARYSKTELLFMIGTGLFKDYVLHDDSSPRT